MCGRFVAATPPSVLAERFVVDEVVVDDRPPSWNVAPTADVYAVARSRRGRRRLGTLRWGLVPSWADNPSGGARHINARAETVATNGVYRESFARRRCIVPADGFYEWQAPAEPGDTKQPYFIRAVDGQALALAGLWDSWRDAEGRWLRTCTIVTTGANDDVAPGLSPPTTRTARRWRSRRPGWPCARPPRAPVPRPCTCRPRHRRTSTRPTPRPSTPPSGSIRARWRPTSTDRYGPRWPLSGWPSTAPAVPSSSWRPTCAPGWRAVRTSATAATARSPSW